MAPMRRQNGTWHSVLRAGFASARLDGLCVSQTETVLGVTYTVRLEAGDGTDESRLEARNAGFDLTSPRGSSLNLQGSTQIGLATTDITTTPGTAPYEPNPLGAPATWAEGFFGADGSGPNAYAGSLNSGHLNGQGWTGIDATRGTLTRVYGDLWQAQVIGNVELPNLRITVSPGSGGDCKTQAQNGVFPR